MGNTSWESTKYRAYHSTTKKKSVDEIFTENEVSSLLDARKIHLRESRDSENHPNSNAIILGVDVSDSMSYLSEYLAKTGIGSIVETLLEKKPIEDPQTMVMAIDDIDSWNVMLPLQVTQFEADTAIFEQLKDIVIKGGGAGNHMESYDWAWAFAACKTYIDCFEKRNKKGYLFTMGDDSYPYKANYPKHLGPNIPYETPDEALASCQEMYHTFHIHLTQGHSGKQAGVFNNWEKKLGKRALKLEKYQAIHDLVYCAIAIEEGNDVCETINSIPSSNQDVVAKALRAKD